uniref:Uncharacterized protein n=1 Tax=Arundo donax TaxID=35708 RepID=A0A0A9HFC9_ARUDO
MLLRCMVQKKMLLRCMVQRKKKCY